jgi:hypothetical protein
MNTDEYTIGGAPMSKTVTLRLSEEEYILFSKAAEAVKRPISNLINYLAQQKLEEDPFVDQIEMDEILGNINLVESLRNGSKDAKLRKGAFVDV